MSSNEARSRMKHGLRGKLMGIALFGCPLMATSAYAAPAVSVPSAMPADHVIQVEAGTHKLLRESVTIRRVAVGDPATADVNVINGRELLISGKSSARRA